MDSFGVLRQLSVARDGKNGIKLALSLFLPKPLSQTLLLLVKRTKQIWCQFIAQKKTKLCELWPEAKTFSLVLTTTKLKECSFGAIAALLHMRTGKIMNLMMALT